MHIIFPTLRQNEFSSAVAFVIVIVATAVTVSVWSLFSWLFGALGKIMVFYIKYISDIIIFFFTFKFVWFKCDLFYVLKVVFCRNIIEV